MLYCSIFYGSTTLILGATGVKKKNQSGILCHIIWHCNVLYHIMLHCILSSYIELQSVVSYGVLEGTWSITLYCNMFDIMLSPVLPRWIVTYHKPNQTGLKPDIFPMWANWLRERNFLKTDTKQEVKWIFRETAAVTAASKASEQSLPPRWTFAEVMRSAAARRGARRDKKRKMGNERFSVSKKFPQFFSPFFLPHLSVH